MVDDNPKNNPGHKIKELHETFLYLSQQIRFKLCIIFLL